MTLFLPLPLGSRSSNPTNPLVACTTLAAVTNDNPLWPLRYLRISTGSMPFVLAQGVGLKFFKAKKSFSVM